MTSWVLFKFKSSKEPTKINFDGTGITVFELKREIITTSHLGDGTDFDLLIYDEGSNEEYTDDTAIIPRSSMVIARRIPAARPGHGRAARYVSGRMPVHARRNDTKASSGADALTAMNNAKTETEKIAAMFAAEDDQWKKQQQEMAQATRVPFKGQARPNMPDRPLPPGYICHRCQQKGHWIYDCPTNDDPNFVPKPKLKKTTGIPRSFLERVEKVDDEEEEDPTKASKGYMIDADGNRVRVKTDTAAWEKEQARQKASAAKKEAAAEANKELQERGLECPIDNRLFDVPTKTPCCSKTYCYQCIEDALVNNDLVCPNCGTENVLLDDLRPDNEMALKIKSYRDEKAAEAEAKEAAETAKAKADAEAALAEAKKAEEEAAANAAANAAAEEKQSSGEEKPDEDSPSQERNGTNDVEPDTDTAKLRSPSPTRSLLSAKSTQMARSKSTETNSKKRSAEDELEEDRVPTAPAAMRKEQERAKLVQDGVLPQFLEDMEKLSKGGLSSLIGNPELTQPNQMANNMPMMQNQMPMGNMNPMMMGNMQGMDMNAVNNNMNNLNMMGGQMNMMNNNMGGGFHNQNNNYNNGYQNNGNWQNRGYNNWNNRGGYQGNYRQYNNQNYNNVNAGFNNYNQGQQRGGFHQGGFNKGHPNEEEDPYFRQPVNPNRHQQRKRLRPSEYTELG